MARGARAKTAKGKGPKEGTKAKKSSREEDVIVVDDDDENSDEEEAASAPVRRASKRGRSTPQTPEEEQSGSDTPKRRGPAAKRTKTAKTPAPPATLELSADEETTATPRRSSRASKIAAATKDKKTTDDEETTKKTSRRDHRNAKTDAAEATPAMTKRRSTRGTDVIDLSQETKKNSDSEEASAVASSSSEESDNTPARGRKTRGATKKPNAKAATSASTEESDAAPAPTSSRNARGKAKKAPSKAAASVSTGKSTEPPNRSRSARSKSKPAPRASNSASTTDEVVKTPTRTRQSSGASASASAATASDEEAVEIEDSSSSADESTPSQRRSTRKHNPVPTYSAPTIKTLATAAAMETFASRPRRAPRPTARTLTLKPTAAVKKGKGRARDSSDDEAPGDLFEAVREGACSTSDLLRGWRSRYTNDADTASRELLNFVLQSCGAAAKSVGADDDLEDLDLSKHVDSIVRDLEAAKDAHYPIVSKTKVFRNFKAHLAEFWEQFVVECWDSELFHSTAVVEICIDWLTALSSAEVRAVRHTATFVAYALGEALVDRACAVRDQMTPITRQYSAEAKKLKDTPKKTPKFLKLQEMKSSYDVQRKKLLAAVDLLFKGVVVHRYRDIMFEVRVASVEALGVWIERMPTVFLEDNYLKYMGWMLNDKAAKVRVAVLEALLAIYETAPVKKLEAFNARFLRRYLEMCDDVDDDVVLSAINLIAKIDRLELLSDDCDLSVVERLVFYDQDERIAKAAAEFACLQYDAFGVSKKELTEAQLTTQAIALVEFAEEYVDALGELDRPMEVLVTAFWDLDDCQVLQNWRLLAKLLASDTQEPALTSEQQTILIQLIGAVLKQMAEDETTTKTRKSLGRKKPSDEEPTSIYFCRELPQLMARFQADSAKVRLLLEWLSLVNWSAANMNQHKKHVEALLARLQQVYVTYSEAPLLAALAAAFGHMTESSNTALAREVELVLFAIAQEGVAQVATHLATDATADDDARYALRAWLARLSFLGGYLDLRDYVKAADRAALAAFVGDRCARFDGDVLAVTYAIDVLLKDLLWTALPIFEALESPRGEEAAVVDAVVARRLAFEDVLLAALSLHLPTPVTRDTPNVHDALDAASTDDAPLAVEMEAVQLAAFQALCDVRCLCAEKFAALAPPLNEVAYTPHAHLLALSQAFYERTVEAEDADASVQKAVLVALASASIWNPKNKRQAASVLKLTTVAPLRPYAKAFGKLLSGLSPVKLLEVQMLALRHTFEDDPPAALELAKSLSQSLGVKLQPALRGSYLKFLAEGVRVAFLMPREDHVGFLAVLKPYLPRLDKAALKELQEHFEATRDAVEDTPPAVTAVLDDFAAVFTGAAAPKPTPSTPATERKRRATALSDDDEDPEDAHVTLRPTKRAAHGRRLRSAPHSDDEVFDVDGRDTDAKNSSEEAKAEERDELAADSMAAAHESEPTSAQEGDQGSTKGAAVALNAQHANETTGDDAAEFVNDQPTKATAKATADGEETESETESADQQSKEPVADQAPKDAAASDDDDVASFRTKRRKTSA
ncbi:cohesin subunit [Achlya hypogyna]|uniref:Cohesin subunit n=1 Tax=Achlya hypogyna TaxID=1202772 RepID=A0A1V9YMW3_ACHHY|nr:cohesin subunit [Achlya hypogyna]